MIQWVDHESVRNREIMGDWRRFTYLCNGHPQYVYAHDKETFIALFIEWSVWAGREGYVNRYSFAIKDLEGVSISLEDMIKDRPEWADFYCKRLLRTKDGREYIQ